MGGLSFHARCPEWTARIERERRDIDLATRSKDRKNLTAILEAQGYAGDRQYNALYGHKQLYFVDEARGRPVDVLIDRMEMCHRFEFADRLAVDSPTVPLAEMLLSKIQIAKINRKDILDALALLSEYPIGAGDAGAINVDRITKLTSNDWGWWRTVSGNLDKLRLLFNTEIQPGELDFRRPPRFDAADQLALLRAAIDAVTEIHALEAPRAGRRPGPVVRGTRRGRARPLRRSTWWRRLPTGARRGAGQGAARSISPCDPAFRVRLAASIE